MLLGCACWLVQLAYALRYWSLLEMWLILLGCSWCYLDVAGLNLDPTSLESWIQKVCNLKRFRLALPIAIADCYVLITIAYCLRFS